MGLSRFFFFTLILILPAQLGYHWWPQWSYVLGRRIDYLSPTLFVSDILIFLLLGCWVLERLTVHPDGFKKIYSQMLIGVHRVEKKYIAVIFVCLLFVFVNVTLSFSKPVTVYKWLKVLEFLLFGYYIVKTKPNPWATICLLIVSGTYSALIGMAQYVAGHSLGGLFWFLGERTFSLDTPGIARVTNCMFRSYGCGLVLRPYATFPHPNVFGGYLAVIGVMLLNLLIIPQGGLYSLVANGSLRRFTVNILLFCFFLITAALLVTFSRSAILVFLVGCAMTAGIKLYKQKKTIPGKNFNILAGLFFLISALYIFFILLPGFQFRAESTEDRQRLAYAAVTLWQSSPLVGVGLGNFLITLPKYTNIRTVSFLQPVHSVYLLGLAEAGIVGMLFVFLFICKLTKYLMSFSVKAMLNSQFFIPLLEIAALGAVDHYFYTLQQAQLLLTICVSVFYNELQNSKVRVREV